MTHQEIITQLPYSEPFLFVDKLLRVNEDGVEGLYIFPKDAYFYEGHFKENPVTPGVLLTECMAQIGVVCLGIYLLGKGANSKTNDVQPIAIPNKNDKLQIALSSSEVQYYAPVFPGEEVRVVSKKLYFRFTKLKCEVRMYNAENILICQGTIAGMLKATDHA